MDVSITFKLVVLHGNDRRHFRARKCPPREKKQLIPPISQDFPTDPPPWISIFEMTEKRWLDVSRKNFYVILTENKCFFNCQSQTAKKNGNLFFLIMYFELHCILKSKQSGSLPAKPTKVAKKACETWACTGRHLFEPALQICRVNTLVQNDVWERKKRLLLVANEDLSTSLSFVSLATSVTYLCFLSKGLELGGLCWAGGCWKWRNFECCLSSAWKTVSRPSLSIFSLAFLPLRREWTRGRVLQSILVWTMRGND